MSEVASDEACGTGVVSDEDVLLNITIVPIFHLESNPLGVPICEVSSRMARSTTDFLESVKSEMFHSMRRYIEMKEGPLMICTFAVFIGCANCGFVACSWDAPTNVMNAHVGVRGYSIVHFSFTVAHTPPTHWLVLLSYSREHVLPLFLRSQAIELC